MTNPLRSSSVSSSRSCARGSTAASSPWRCGRLIKYGASNVATVRCPMPCLAGWRAGGRIGSAAPSGIWMLNSPRATWPGAGVRAQGAAGARRGGGQGHADGALKAFPVLMRDRGRRRPTARHSRFNHFVADCITHKSRGGRDLELTQDRCSVGHKGSQVSRHRVGTDDAASKFSGCHKPSARALGAGAAGTSGRPARNVS